MKQVGIIGAGIMGTGIAQVAAQYGYQVVLVDLEVTILEHARENICRNIKIQALYNNQEVLPEEIMEKIEFTTDYKKLEDVDILIENIIEDIDKKHKLYEKISNICKEDCIFAVNTSCISITKIASKTSRADKVIGTHFMNPVPMKLIVEVVKGYHTSQETIDKTLSFLNSIGKSGILVNDMPGFVSNRISHLLINEAAYVIQDQVASAEDVDTIFKKCFGHKMGPLETADLIGLDVVVASLNILYNSYQDSKYRACPLLTKMVDAGLFGMKSGHGFYEYMN
jgi:3-hydroxybutyryl-CoA dehydrogenase